MSNLLKAEILFENNLCRKVGTDVKNSFPSSQNGRGRWLAPPPAWLCLRFNKSFSVPLSPSRSIAVVYLTNILGSLTYNIKCFDVTAVVHCC